MQIKQIVRAAAALAATCFLVACSTVDSASTIRNGEFRQRYLAWRLQCVAESKRQNGLLAAYVDTPQFSCLTAMGRSALPDIIRLGRAYDTSQSERYKSRNSCDRFMAYAATRITGVERNDYETPAEFWDACEKSGQLVR